jgi:hypothetical protein
MCIVSKNLLIKNLNNFSVDIISFYSQFFNKFFHWIFFKSHQLELTSTQFTQDL